MMDGQTKPNELSSIVPRNIWVEKEGKGGKYMKDLKT